jgi:hypothetical protein
MVIARAMFGFMCARVAALCFSCSLQKYLERWRAALNEAGPSLGINDNEETHNPEMELNAIHL